MAQNNGMYQPGGLGDLLTASPSVQEYFDALPQYVQDMVRQRENNIHSEDELRRYAENLLAGDK